MGKDGGRNSGGIRFVALAEIFKRRDGKHEEGANFQSDEPKGEESRNTWITMNHRGKEKSGYTVGGRMKNERF